MIYYDTVLIYSKDGGYVGAALRNVLQKKLQSFHIYTAGEEEHLEKYLGELNESALIKANWPDARDPEVEAYINDPTFMPLKMESQEVIDTENSDLIYFPDTADIDPRASKVVTKTIMAPVIPTEAMERTKHALELVARKRAGLTS